MTSPAAPGEARKVVTVLFSDVIGSTVLSTELDSESLRRLMARFFEEMKAVLQRHGGTTEKFIGDAVMAVFGVPRVHEDDALRAVRAAVEMRERLRELNKEFERTWGVRIITRTGVNTGEVVAGDPSGGESFAAGDAVNMAARLQQSAQPGEILIGASTHRLIREVAMTESVSPLVVKGKIEPLSAWRLLDVSLQEPGRISRLDSPLVGRDLELEVLHDIFRRVLEKRGCELVTIMAPAGLGKSRLTAEFLSGLGGLPRMLRGRCLAYGEGITFWPIVEVIREAAGIGSPEEARPKLLELLVSAEDASLISEGLVALLGPAAGAPDIRETFWSVRKLLERLAEQRPLVVVFDDIHWGEPTFLDLVEYLVDWVHDVPLMLVCLARPELLEVRGSWMTGKSNVSMINLPPLTEKETDGLIRHLLAGGELSEETRERIEKAAEGNPLFIEEMLQMLVDDGLLLWTNGSWTAVRELSTLSIPPTIQALLTARLDRLEVEERAVIERASVIGRVFWWGAVSDLSQPGQRARVGEGLHSLIRKELIGPDRSELANEDAFRFSHILIRDAAYRGIPKATRSDLHERFADWLRKKSRDLAGQYDEIIGYHLEQAYLALSELGPVNERTRALGRHAAELLTSVGRRAFGRGDMPASVNLLSRAASLYNHNDPRRIQLLPDLAFALLEMGDLGRMQDVVVETAEAARTSGKQSLDANALILSLWMRLFTNPEGWAEEALRGARRALSIFEADGDEQGLARAWSLLGLLHVLTCQFATSEEAWEKAVGHAHAAGIDREEYEYLSWIPLVVLCGPTPVDECITRCQEVLERAAGNRKAMSTSLFAIGTLEAMRGRLDEAETLIGQAQSILKDVALTVWLAGPLTQISGWTDIVRGDPVAAEQTFRWGVQTLTETRELAWLPTAAALLAEALYAQEKYDEAESFLMVTEGSAASEDLYSQALLRSIRAKLLARREEFDRAEKLGRDALVLTERTDFLVLKAFVRLSLREVLSLAGQHDEAQSLVVESIQLSEAKGFTIGAERARKLLHPAR